MSIKVRRSACRSTVKDATVDRPISFKLDVMPVFMRSGCNTGSCHGAARGKDGFNLSLFGYDPDGDHHRLTHEIGFRRINLALPRESLMMQKADGSVPHTGGKRFAPTASTTRPCCVGSKRACPRTRPTCRSDRAWNSIRRKAVLEGKDTTQQFIARAKYSDGTDRDVTDLAVFLTNNDNSAPISADGLVTPAARGEAFVMARFATHTVGSQVLVLAQGLAIHAAHDAAGQLRRRAGQRQAAEASHAAQRAVQRRGVPAPGHDRHHGPAADGRRVPGLHGRHRPGQAGQAGRSAA